MNVQFAELVKAFEANCSVTRMAGVLVCVPVGQEGSEAACRCYRCGNLLTVDTVMVDVGRWGIRPICESCREGRVTGE